MKNLIQDLKNIQKQISAANFYLEHLEQTKTLAGYILDISKEFVCIKEINDFKVDGVVIFPLKHIESIRYGKYDKTLSKIIKKEGLLSSAMSYSPMELDSYQNIFKSIKKNHQFVIIESVYKGDLDFCIGEIKRINKKTISIHYFDASGKFDPELSVIPYDEILNIEFNCPYINIFKKYLHE